MTTTTLDITRAGIDSKGWTRLLPSLGGLALVGGLIGIMLSPASDDTGETAAEVVAYSRSHETWTIAILLFGLASLAFGGAFVAGLHARLQGIATATESALVLIGGILFTLCFSLCWIMWTAPLADTPSDDTGRARAGAGVPRRTTTSAGSSSAPAVSPPRSWPCPRRSLRSAAGCRPGSGGSASSLGLASVATVAFFGMFAWMTWIAAASIVLLAARRS